MTATHTVWGTFCGDDLTSPPVVTTKIVIVPIAERPTGTLQVAGVHVAEPSRNTRPVKIPAEVPPTGRLRPISLACAGLSAGGQLIAPVTKRS